MPIMSKRPDELARAPEAQPRPAPAMVVQSVPDQQTDPFFYRVLIIGLVAAVLTTIAGTIALAAMQRPVPEGLIAIGSAAVGGLVGLLVPSPTR